MILYLCSIWSINIIWGDFMANEAMSEKVSVNINVATLSSIDLLVDGGYYSNRSDFINQALRDALQRQQSTIDRIFTEKNDGHFLAVEDEARRFFAGVRYFSNKEIDYLYSQNKKIQIHGYGALVFEKDCDTDKLFSVVESISIKGKLNAPDTVKKHYGF